jgi:hypothetical protein
MDWLWPAVALAALAAVSVAAGSLYRDWLIDRRRWRSSVALSAIATLTAMLWIGARSGWLLAAVIAFTVFVLVTRIVGPWAYLMWAAPVRTLAMDKFADAFADRLVGRPALVARLECYDEHAVLDCAYSWLDSVIGRNAVRIPYAGQCIVCAVQRGFEAAETAARNGALAGITEDFRRSYAEHPRFVLAFKPRPPEVLWQWGHRPVTIVPAHLCSEHRLPSSRQPPSADTEP